MKFMVRRTSTHGDGKPCKEAFEEEYVYIDERTIGDPRKIPVGEGCDDTSWWYDEGKNHRVEKGRIRRDFVETGWFIELDSLSKLLAFIDKRGEVIIGESWNNPEIYQIEIYDDYRE